MKAATLATVVKFWCENLGANQFAPDKVLVTSHKSDLIDTLENRIFCLMVGTSTYITAPKAVVAEIEEVSEELAVSTIECLIRLFKNRGKVVGDGPAYIGYRDLPIERSTQVSKLQISDPRVDSLKLAQPLDWDHFGYVPDSQGLFARTDDGRLVGLAHYEVWGGKIAQIGVIVERAARGSGVGQEVVTAAVNDALKNGLIPQYRTLLSNVPSMKIAKRLGFEHFGDSLVIKYGER